MCGIVGAISEKNVTSILLEGLKKLEYRGYDSAGLCVMDADKQLHRVRALGKVQALEDAVHEISVRGSCGIAHTRWATHGIPAEHNAHPLVSDENTEFRVAVVHNGIIENHVALREKLQAVGYIFHSETDSETAAHLMQYYLEQTKDFLTALIQVSSEMQGAFALGVMCSAYPDTLGVIRKGSPLVIGIGSGEHFIASDPIAVLPRAEKFIYLEEGDIGLITRTSVSITDKNNQVVNRPEQAPLWAGETVSKGSYRHFMLKEIYEQPHVVLDTMEGRFSPTHVLPEILGVNAASILEKTKAIHIIACGTSYHAGLVARYWFEKMTGLPCQVEVASEFRYRQFVVFPGTLLVAISQSGETADTLAALRHAKSIGEKGGYAGFLGICNVPGSSLVRESECVLMTRAGVEIGVASTKAFTAQLTALFMLVLLCAYTRRSDEPTRKDLNDSLDILKKLPALCQKILTLDAKIQQVAHAFADKHHALFIGRGTQVAIAMEGALKLKEISYIHAEAYPAGELKHGALALVDKNMPVIVIAPHDELIDKLKSNIEEIKTRGGQCFIFTDERIDFVEDTNSVVIRLPAMDALIAPIAYTIPLQLLAYHVAVLKGTDVDQPRNLAKSVTVE